MKRVLLVAALVSIFGVANARAAYESRPAEAATQLPVLCFMPSELAQLGRVTGEPGAGYWLPEEHLIVVEAVLCRDLAHRFGLSHSEIGRVSLGEDIVTLGHEATHADQQAAGRPFDEHEADCGGIAKFALLRARLGLPHSVRPPFTLSQFGC